MTSSPHPNPLFSPDVPLPEMVRSRAPEISRVRSELELIALDALRRAVTAKFFATLGAESQLRDDLRTVCCEAKRTDARAEQLIVAFKNAWRELPEARTLPQGTQGQEFLSRIITLCIAEYYSTRAD